MNINVLKKKLKRVGAEFADPRDPLLPVVVTDGCSDTI